MCFCWKNQKELERTSNKNKNIQILLHCFHVRLWLVDVFSFIKFIAIRAWHRHCRFYTMYEHCTLYTATNNTNATYSRKRALLLFKFFSLSFSYLFLAIFSWFSAQKIRSKKIILAYNNNNTSNKLYVLVL